MTDQPTNQNTDNLIRAAAFDLGYRLGRIEGKLDVLLARLDRAAARVDLDAETEKFLNWNRQHDRRYSDWVAAWRNWILKAQDFADERQQRATGTDTDRKETRQ